MKKLLLISLLGLTVSCNQELSKCDPTSIVIIDEGEDKISTGNSEFYYDLEFKNFNRSCVSDESVKELALAMSKNKKLKFPISTVRCFEYNGGGMYNDIEYPSGCDELRFLIIFDIDSLGNFLKYEKVNIE